MKNIMIAAVAFASLSTMATEFNCYGKKGEIEITLNARMGEFDGEAKIGLIQSYNLLIEESVRKVINGIEFKDHTSISDRNISNIPYNGKKYKGYLKFDLLNYSSENFSMNGGVDNIEFIVSPNYKVIATESRANHWTPSWTWDVETREFDAVFPLNINDHHGDYVSAKCYTSAIVNEVRP